MFPITQCARSESEGSFFLLFQLSEYFLNAVSTNIITFSFWKWWHGGEGVHTNVTNEQANEQTNKKIMNERTTRTLETATLAGSAWALCGGCLFVR